MFSAPRTEDRVAAVIFDLDGSLVDSMWMWRAIDEEYLARYDIRMPDDLQAELAGRSIQETAVYFKQRFGISDPEETMLRDWNAMALDKYCHQVPLKQGAGALLARCRSCGILLGVATSNSRVLTEAALSANGVADCFGAVVTGDEVTEGKPDPGIFLAAAGILGIHPERCLVFEDVVWGIQAARRAGMHVISVYDAQAAEQEETKKKLADQSILDYTELDLDAIQEETQV